MIYEINGIRNATTRQIKGGRWVLARPIEAPFFWQLGKRLRAAWEVIAGRGCVVLWH